MDAKDIALIKAMGKSASSGDIKNRTINLMDYGVDVYRMFIDGTEQYTIEDTELRDSLWGRIQAIYKQGNIPILVISMDIRNDYYAEIQGMSINGEIVYWVNTTLYVYSTNWVGAAIGLSNSGIVLVHKIL